MEQIQRMCYINRESDVLTLTAVWTLDIYSHADGMLAVDICTTVATAMLIIKEL